MFSVEVSFGAGKSLINYEMGRVLKATKIPKKKAPAIFLPTIFTLLTQCRIYFGSYLCRNFIEKAQLFNCNEFLSANIDWIESLRFTLSYYESLSISPLIPFPRTYT